MCSGVLVRFDWISPTAVSRHCCSAALVQGATRTAHCTPLPGRTPPSGTHALEAFADTQTFLPAENAASFSTFPSTTFVPSLSW